MINYLLHIKHSEGQIDIGRTEQYIHTYTCRTFINLTFIVWDLLLINLNKF